MRRELPFQVLIHAEQSALSEEIAVLAQRLAEGFVCQVTDKESKEGSDEGIKQQL